MMQRANVSHGKTKMDKTVRKRGVSCGHRSRPFYTSQVVRGTLVISMERKKGDEKAKKKQSKGKWKNRFLYVQYSHSRSVNIGNASYKST
jgi:protein-tyrosine-phosphatase